MDRQALTRGLKEQARALGFDLVGVCPAVEPTGLSQFYKWLAQGYAGQMRYLESRAEAYSHPRGVLEGVRSLLMLAIDYATETPRGAQPGEGRISRYAWGADYHELLRPRLHALADWLREQVPGCMARGVVDTAPLLERDFAQLAGLGWIGKNTLLLNKRRGSWFFLAALLTDVTLEYDEVHASDHCGTCRACLDACPTDAFVEAYQLDARRCISYLTIELRGSIPRELRPGMGEWVFGCDVCQEVCPWNRQTPYAAERGFWPRAGANPLELAPLFELDDAAFRERFRETPLWRPKRRGVLRNAAIVLGNAGDQAAVACLQRGLDDREPLVRGAAAWALGKLGGDDARAALAARRELEADVEVRTEIEDALRACAASETAGPPD